MCIGVQMAATRVLSPLAVGYNQLSGNCDALPYRCGYMSTNITGRKEVNVQCLK